MPVLYIMVALPRAGKSTYVDRYFRDKVKVSADRLRLIVYGRRFSAGGEARVWWVRGVMLEALLEQGLDIVIDETSTTRGRRTSQVRLAKKHGYKSIAVVLKTDAEECKRRAIETGQEDLVPVIDKMAQDYEEVTGEEGFDEIIFV